MAEGDDIKRIYYLTREAVCDRAPKAEDSANSLSAFFHLADVRQGNLVVDNTHA